MQHSAPTIPTPDIFKHHAVTPGQARHQEPCVHIPSEPGRQLKGGGSVLHGTNEDRRRPCAGWNGKAGLFQQHRLQGAILKGIPAWMTLPDFSRLPEPHPRTAAEGLHQGQPFHSPPEGKPSAKGTKVISKAFISSLSNNRLWVSVRTGVL